MEESIADEQQLAPYYAGRPIRQVLKETGSVTRWVFAICLLVFIVTGQGSIPSVRAPLDVFPDVLAMGRSANRPGAGSPPVFVHISGFGICLLNMPSCGSSPGRWSGWCPLRLLALFLVCAVVSNWTEFLWSRDTSAGYRSRLRVGGYLWFYGRFRPESHRSCRLPWWASCWWR